MLDFYALSDLVECYAAHDDAPDHAGSFVLASFNALPDEQRIELAESFQQAAAWDSESRGLTLLALLERFAEID